MELKLYIIKVISVRGILLIVPYGIETEIQQSTKITQILLIVPYGIETVIVCSA